MALTGCSPESSEPPIDVTAEATGESRLPEGVVAGGVDHLFMPREELDALPDVVDSWTGGEISREASLAAYTDQVEQVQDHGLEGVGAEGFARDALDSLIDTLTSSDSTQEELADAISQQVMVNKFLESQMVLPEPTEAERPASYEEQRDAAGVATLL